MQRIFFHLIIAGSFLAACTRPQAEGTASYGPMTVLRDAEADKLLAQADTVINVGKPIVDETEVADTSGRVMFHIIRTSQPVWVDLSTATGRQRRPFQGTSSDSNGIVQCTLTCQDVNNGQTCTHAGCDADGGNCSPGNCKGGCTTSGCTKTYIGPSGTATAIQ